MTTEYMLQTTSNRESHEALILNNLKEQGGWMGMAKVTKSLTKLDQTEVIDTLNELVNREQVLTRQHPQYPSTIQYKRAPQVQFGS